LAGDRAGNEVPLPIAGSEESRHMKLGGLRSARSPKLE
jgi:hypothetical protein